MRLKSHIIWMLFILVWTLGINACAPATQPSHPQSTSLTVRLIRTLEGQKHLVKGAAYHPDGSQFVTIDTNGGIFFWNPAGERLWSTEISGVTLQSVVFAPDGARVLFGGQPSYLMEMDLTSHKMQVLSHGEDQTSFSSVAYSPSGDLMAVGVSDATLRIYQRGNPQPLKWVAHEWPVQAVLFMNEAFVLSGDPQTVKLWNIESGQLVRTLIDTQGGAAGSVNWMSALAFSEDANYVVAASGNEVIAFDLTSTEILQRFSGHTEEIEQVGISSDLTRIYSAGRDHTTIFWDAETGQQLGAAVSPDLVMPSVVAVSPLNDHLVIGGMFVDVFGGAFTPVTRIWAIEEGD